MNSVIAAASRSGWGAARRGRRGLAAAVTTGSPNSGWARLAAPPTPWGGDGPAFAGPAPLWASPHTRRRAGKTAFALPRRAGTLRWPRCRCLGGSSAPAGSARVPSYPRALPSEPGRRRTPGSRPTALPSARAPAARTCSPAGSVAEERWTRSAIAAGDQRAVRSRAARPLLVRWSRSSINLVMISRNESMSSNRSSGSPMISEKAPRCGAATAVLRP